MARVGNQQFNHIYRRSTATGPQVTIPRSGTSNRLHQNITPVTSALLFLELNYNKQTLEKKSPSPDTRGGHQKHAARAETAPRAISNTCGTRRRVLRSHHQSHTHTPLAGIASPIRNRRPQYRTRVGEGGREGRNLDLDVDVLGGLLLLAEDLAAGGQEPALHEPRRRPGRHRRRSGNPGGW